MNGKTASPMKWPKLVRDTESEEETSTPGSQCVSEPTRVAAKDKKITAKRLYALLVDQGFQCKYTGVHLTPETASLDHVIPVSDEFGEHAIGNVVWVHTIVNTMKGTLPLEDFVNWCRLIGTTFSENAT